MSWDYKIPRWLANIFVLGLPLLIFLLGMRKFTAMIDLIGGVFISIEMMIILLIYWKAKKTGALEKPEYSLHHTLLLGIFLLIILTIGAIYSITKLF